MKKYALLRYCLVFLAIVLPYFSAATINGPERVLAERVPDMEEYLPVIVFSQISPDMKKMTVTGKGSKMRTIYLNTACRNALRAYLEVRQSSVHVRITDPNALFLSSRGNRISNKTVQWMVKKQLAQIGLGKGYSTHKLRHTAATLMYSEGNVDVRALKDMLGHEQLNTTQIYTHVSDKKLEAAMEANPLAKKK